MDPLARLTEQLKDPAAYPHPVAGVTEVDTHISRVLLAGAFAYKFKKPVNLGFVDFSTLARRRFFCDEEVRLNRRLAPQLYLDVVAITEADGHARIGGPGEPVEYAVRMRRFPDSALLSHQPLDGALIDRLADRIAAFHTALPPAAADSPHAALDAVLAPMLENFAHIHRAVHGAGGIHAGVARLEAWTRARFEQLGPRLEARRRNGCIRECHGDMHRGNIALIDGEPVIFDCIEFNPGLRWIDTMSELAFLVMDLTEAGAPGLARRLLNRYLERTGDYGGLGVLDLYQVYRALVRAKVIAIRLTQDDLAAAERAPLWAELKRYLALARAATRRPAPQLVITHGVSGSGKTWLGAQLREHLALVQVRSDVERKRLFGLPPEARTPAARSAEVYGPEATRRTYRRLAEVTGDLLAAGCPVLVDAMFLTRNHRRAFRDLARAHGCPFRVLVLDAPVEVLRRRVAERALRGADASDAEGDVLAGQLATREPLDADEERFALRIASDRPAPVATLVRRLRETGQHI